MSLNERGIVMMKGDIYISTVGERLEKVLSIVGDFLVKVFEPIPGACDECLVQISATDKEWEELKTLLMN
jgi:hypothetical protein